MSRVIKTLVAAIALGLAVLLVVKFVLPRFGTHRPSAVPVAEPEPGLSSDLVARLEGAGDLVAPDLFREAIERQDSRAARAELGRLREERAERARVNLGREVDDLLNGFRYGAASELVQRYRRAWKGTAAAARMREFLDGIQGEQRDQVAQRKEEALALVEAGRYDAARDALRTDWELEKEFKAALAEASEEIERRIRVHAHNAGRPPPAPTTEPVRPGAKVTLRGEPSSPPPLPGFPHPDVKRLGEARALLAKARQLFGGRRYQPAADAMSELVGYYGDLKYVQRRREAVGALDALARHGARGPIGLFHATKAEKLGKRRVRLRYRFESDAEYLDWEELATIFRKGEGGFRPVRNGVQGSGVMTYLLKAWFENDVRIRAVSRPTKKKSHGLALCQAGLETRQLLWLVCNHWFTEGENYVKERPGHSLIMIGKGVNADVPVDSPEVGFIFRGSSITKPDPPGGASLQLSWELKKNTMSGEIEYKGVRGALSGSTVGDDGRSIEKTRPGLFVVEAAVVFRDIVIEGKLHPSFEEERISELLQIASMLE